MGWSGSRQPPAALPCTWLRIAWHGTTCQDTPVVSGTALEQNAVPVVGAQSYPSPKPPKTENTITKKISRDKNGVWKRR
eukprot:6488303-Amphidinium_carterae.1